MIAVILASGAARRGKARQGASRTAIFRPDQPFGYPRRIPLLAAMPAACMTEAIAAPQLLRDIGWRRRFAHRGRLAAPWFAGISRHTRSENKTEFCCILSGIIARGQFASSLPMSYQHALKAIAFCPAAPVENR
jgi:hypothetical protein